MNTPANLAHQSTTHECLLVVVEEWLDLSGHSSLLSCFDWLVAVCSSDSVWETHHGLQERKLL
jgi:hypothetical protein